MISATVKNSKIRHVPSLRDDHSNRQRPFDLGKFVMSKLDKWSLIPTYMGFKPSRVFGWFSFLFMLLPPAHPRSAPIKVHPYAGWLEYQYEDFSRRHDTRKSALTLLRKRPFEHARKHAYRAFFYPQKEWPSSPTLAITKIWPREKTSTIGIAWIVWGQKWTKDFIEHRLPDESSPVFRPNFTRMSV